MTTNKPSPRGWTEIYVSIALVTLASIAVTLRFVARCRRNLDLKMDDWFALGGLILIYGMFVDGIIFATVGGNGKHNTEYNVLDFESFEKILLSNEFLFAVTSPTVKISIILFYRSIFITRRFRIAADSLIVLCTLWGIATFVTTALQCRPLKAFWDPLVPAYCFGRFFQLANIPEYFLSTQIVNIALDFAILCMPIWMIWKLRVHAHQKIELLGIFVLGAFAVNASIMRLVAFSFIMPEDPFYSFFWATIWTFIEPCVGIICGCLPIIRGLFPAYKSRASRQNPPFEAQNDRSRVALNPYGRHLQNISLDELRSIVVSRSSDLRENELVGTGVRRSDTGV